MAQRLVSALFEPHAGPAAAHVARLKKDDTGVIKRLDDRRQGAAARVGSTALNIFDRDLGHTALSSQLLLRPAEQGSGRPDLRARDHIRTISSKIPCGNHKHTQGLPWRNQIIANYYIYYDTERLFE